MSARAALMILVLAAPAARADLPADGWPQPRRDARRTARSPEPSIADPEVILAEPVGEALLGEPAAAGCDLFVGNGGGDVLRVNVRGAGRGWRASQQLPPCGDAAASPSSVAVDSSGQVLAGLAGDAGLAALMEALCRITAACESHAIDNNQYPPGLDLRAELWPYIDPWPLNPCTGAELLVTDMPSPGDMRYALEPATQFMFIGGWWTDGGLVSLRQICARNSSTELHPSWPVSTVLGAGGIALDTADGRLRWRAERRGLSLRSTPALLPGAIAWAQGGIPGWAGGAGGGRLIVTDEAGNITWSAPRFAGYAGGVARDDAGDALHAAVAPAASAALIDGFARTLATACESYSIDAGLYPPEQELAPLLVPMYLRGMPPNVLEGGTATWSLTPSPGGYFYESFNGRTEYRLGYWNSEGERVAIMETGLLVQPAQDEPARVTCLARTDGALRWSSALPAGVEPTPVMLTDRGIVLGGSDGVVRCLARDDGRELWTVPTGVPLGGAPAELPDGGLAWSHPGGLLVVNPADRVRFSIPLAAGVIADPAVTADGVIYLGDLAGTLHAIDSAGATRWTRDCTIGASGPAGLTTTAIPHEGWIHVGRSDGWLVSLAPAGTVAWPEPLGGVLLAWRTASSDEARLDWTSSPLGSSLGEHYHLHSATDPRGPWLQLLPHDFVETGRVDATPGLPLVFYRLANATCGEQEPPTR